MAVSKQEDPRANQKERTRAALVAAAAGMLREGIAPGVAEAAQRAKVSRATAYRYFPTQDSLLVEVTAVNPAIAPVEEMLDSLEGADANERMRRLLHSFIPIVQAEEMTMRTAKEKLASSPRPAIDAAGRLGLAAAPTLALMAWMSAVGSPAMTMCSAASAFAPLNEMALMYALMSAFHTAPWLKLIARRRNSARPRTLH